MIYICTMHFKKQICLFIAFVLLVSNTGVAINVHYCADEIASISIFSNSNANEIEKNCCGIVEEFSNCCENKIIKSEKKSDQIFEKHYSFEILSFVLPSVLSLFEQQIATSFQKLQAPKYTCNANAPPIFELNCQRIFYA